MSSMMMMMSLKISNAMICLDLAFPVQILYENQTDNMPSKKAAMISKGELANVQWLMMRPLR